jgi:hypothetical protein
LPSGRRGARSCRGDFAQSDRLTERYRAALPNWRANLCYGNFQKVRGRFSEALNLFLTARDALKEEYVRSAKANLLDLLTDATYEIADIFSWLQDFERAEREIAKHCTG